MLRKLTLALSALLLAVGFAGPANAVVFAEVGDVSNVFGSEQNVGGGVDAIDGGITPGDEGDLYKLVFDFTGPVTFSLIEGDEPEVFIFDGVGGPIFHIDFFFAPAPEFTVNVAPGTYFLGIGDFDTDAIDQEGDRWDFGVAPAIWGTLDFIENAGFIDPFNYRIELSEATASVLPEPASIALLGFGIFGLGFAVRRMRVV